MTILFMIGRPTLPCGARGISIVSEFRKRLNNHQMLVADFKGLMFPIEKVIITMRLVDLITVMAAAQMKRFKKRLLVQTFTRNSLPSI